MFTLYKIIFYLKLLTLMVKVGHKLTLKGKNNSVETTWLAITETRHDFLIQEDLLQTSLYGRQE